MARPKKEKPNRADGRYEYKAVIGRKINGSPIRKSFYSYVSKEDAKKQAEQFNVNNKVEELTGYQLNDRNMTFEQWATKWLEAYKRNTVSELTFRSTYSLYVNSHLIPYFGKTELTQIKPADIQIFYNTLTKKLSQSSIEKVRLCLNGIFDTAIDNDYCIKNPCKGINPKSNKGKLKKSTYSRAECYALMKYAKQHEYGIYPILLLCMGLRCGELCGLKWEDIDIENKVIHIERAITRENYHPIIVKPKTKTSVRTLPFSSSLSKYLQSQKKNKNGFIVQNKDGDIMLPSNFTKYRYDKFMKDFENDVNYSRKNKMELLNPHELRHTCGTLLYERTQNIYAVSKFLGHADVQITTQIYIHNSVESLRNSLGLS